MSQNKDSPLKTISQMILANRPAAVKPLRTIKVGLVEIDDDSEQRHFPLSTGMLRAYAQKHLVYAGAYEFDWPVDHEVRVEEASEKLSDCDLVAVSSYVWNEQKSLAYAKDYKRRRPDGLIIFGGPQVPDSMKQFRKNRTIELNPDELKRQRIHFTEDFHRAHPEIDICCHGEGERVFKIILEQMAIDNCRDRKGIPSISYLDREGSFHFNVKLDRMNDQELSQVPSPFTSGVFDKLFNIHPDREFTFKYETNRGCPYTCAYCEWGGATEDKVFCFPMEQIYADFRWAGEHRMPYIFLCDANFGILRRDVQIAEFLAEVKAKYGYPEAVSTQNAKNPKKHTLDALKILEKAGINKVAVLSQQSLNPLTLKAVRRENMELQAYYTIQRELAAANVHTMTDLILGMPEETYDSILDGICTLMENGQHNRIQFNNLSILRNTEMGNPEYQTQYDYKIVRSKITKYHGTKGESISGIDEYQEFVVGTSTMPPEDWIKTRALCHLVNLLYFDKLLQIPIIILHEVYQLPYRRIWDTIMEKTGQQKEFPVLSEIFGFFSSHAREMQNGGDELAHSAEYLNLYWYPDELVFIKLVRENKLEEFYQEAEKIVDGYLEFRRVTDILPEAVRLNQALIKLPFQTSDLTITLHWNIWEICQEVLLGKAVPVIPGYYQCTIDRTTAENRWNSWEEWYRKMVWHQNRRGAYLYGNKNPHPEVVGYH